MVLQKRPISPERKTIFPTTHSRCAALLLLRKLLNKARSLLQCLKKFRHCIKSIRMMAGIIPLNWNTLMAALMRWNVKTELNGWNRILARILAGFYRMRAAYRRALTFLRWMRLCSWIPENPLWILFSLWVASCAKVKVNSMAISFCRLVFLLVLNPKSHLLIMKNTKLCGMCCKHCVHMMIVLTIPSIALNWTKISRETSISLAWLVAMAKMMISTVRILARDMMVPSYPLIWQSGNNGRTTSTPKLLRSVAAVSIGKRGQKILPRLQHAILLKSRYSLRSLKLHRNSMNFLLDYEGVWIRVLIKMMPLRCLQSILSQNLSSMLCLITTASCKVTRYHVLCRTCWMSCMTMHWKKNRKHWTSFMPVCRSVQKALTTPKASKKLLLNCMNSFSKMHFQKKLNDWVSSILRLKL